MPLKDLLVHADDTEQSIPRLATAVELAAAHGAHLGVLYVRQPFFFPPHGIDGMTADVLDAQKVASLATAGEIKDKHSGTLNASGIKCEWRSEEGIALDVIAKHARYSDLVVVGQGPSNGGAADDLAGSLVLASGRPVLVVPRSGKHSGKIERIMVAWDGGSHAARAVNDALPLLQAAQMVTVLTINPGKNREGHGDIPSADISLHLARHGVKVNGHSLAAGGLREEEMLLARAADDASDLIVMGAYGHSRLREFILGGVTRYMLENMTVPVLMSH